MSEATRNAASRPSKEQVIYANILVMGVWSGIAILFITYFIYLSGIMPTYVEITEIPKLWGLGVNEYLEHTHSPHGWGWVALLGNGDFLNYIGFALLALMTVVCYLVLLKGYFAKKDWIYAAIAVLEIVVLSVAASGLLGSGGH
ncbi:MAG TPA: DUF1634 domain-containing protein [Desulfobacteraceae bacterium]|nr:DUF1634 domain-containing protein [Desulfobacteraceae bacterium]